ncbi:MAG: hypothetical protein ACFFC3_11495 [Candidatus Odinarchaeota archaeon]
MENLNAKSLMVITIVITSVFTMPIAVMGQEKDYNDTLNLNQVDAGIFDGFRGGFGAIFRNDNLGYAGQILSSVFEALLIQGLNLTKHEEMDSVYVLSANTTRTISGVKNFTSQNNKEIYLLPNDYRVPDNQGFAYCEITKTGSYSFELEVGAAITLIIWDHDKSFVDAINRVLGFMRKLLRLQQGGGQISQDVIKEGISIITWFLIHINDIFTGDELFILNPITWQKLDIVPSDYNLEKNWKLTGSDYNISDDDILVENGYSEYLTYWENNATNKRDKYMEWLFTSSTEGDLAEKIWTQFSFDLIQLWIKNFEIHIDVSEIIDAISGGGGSAEEAIVGAFNGCDIEYYLFTHHLAGAFLYDDMDSNNKISANYVNVTDDNGDLVLDEAGDPIQIPDRSELSHRIILGTVGEFEFIKPDPSEGENSISWGLNITNVNISAVPMFVDLDSYLRTDQENLEYIYFGFTFIPTRDEETGYARGNVKLDQFFAPWNDGNGPNSEIAGLDLAIIYVSTVLHFHLNVDINEEADRPEVILNPNEDYVEESHELKVGNYIGRRAEEKLDFVDIAGPFYRLGDDNETASEFDASTNILPLVLYKWELDRHDTFELANGTESKTYASDIRIRTEFDVMVYAVCYPEFNGTGQGVWHDPTFSVYMVFGEEGFWAIIVLIAGVSLVGVATILIKRRKDRRY